MESKALQPEEAVVKPPETQQDSTMVSSMISLASSLASPVTDSGVQLLDSEADISSVMSASGIGCDLDLASSHKDDAKVDYFSPDDVANSNTHWEDTGMDTVQATTDNRSADSYVFVSPAKNAPDGCLMHVSMSEEVLESLKADTSVVEGSQRIEQVEIVYRRQKKAKKDKETAKKRVSFHEDILNSTKIDDIRINRGFVSYGPLDSGQGRHSWAAEGDSPFRKPKEAHRQVLSDIYVGRHSTTSSSSSSELSSSTSFEENAEENPRRIKKKKSCLKKTNHRPIPISMSPKESNLLDTDLFGSLKNMISASVTENGILENTLSIPEVETSLLDHSPVDATVQRPIEEQQLPPNRKMGRLNLTLSRSSLKLKGFYPNYPNNPDQEIPENAIICDSHVYEHRGVCSTYQYEEFKKILEQETNTKPKPFTIFGYTLRDIFKKKPKEAAAQNSCETAAIPPENIQKSPEEVKERKGSVPSSIPSVELNSERMSDSTEGSRHLASPKRRIKKPNHYSVQSLTVMDTSSEDGQLRQSSSKTSMINRFLRNVTEKKMRTSKLQTQRALRRKQRRLHFPRVEPDWDSSRAADLEIETELKKCCKRRVSCENILGRAVCDQLRRKIFRNHSERLLHAFKGRTISPGTGETKPLVVLVTTTTLYIIGSQANGSFLNRFVLPFSELASILLGPSANLVVFSNKERDMQFIVSTGDPTTSANIVSGIEFAIRKFEPRFDLPAVRQLHMQDMAQLRHVIHRQTAVEKDEEFYHYCIVCIQDLADDSLNPLGPYKEGPLMFRSNPKSNRWETGYFILKGGVLYMLASPTNRLPKKVIPISNGCCAGARRTPRCTRPYTFEIVTGNSNSPLHLAAPDDYEVSEWLQVLIQAASGLFSGLDSSMDKSCSLLMTNEHLVMVQESFGTADELQVLSCASIIDLTVVKVPEEGAAWCLIEFSCGEVHDNIDDWILHFSNKIEMDKFISTLKMLWEFGTEDQQFPIGSISAQEPLSIKGKEVHNMLLTAWKPFGLFLE